MRDGDSNMHSSWYEQCLGVWWEDDEGVCEECSPRDEYGRSFLPAKTVSARNVLTRPHVCFADPAIGHCPYHVPSHLPLTPQTLDTDEDFGVIPSLASSGVVQIGPFVHVP